MRFVQIITRFVMGWNVIVISYFVKKCINKCTICDDDDKNIEFIKNYTI
jgi:hypothetical protein